MMMPSATDNNINQVIQVQPPAETNNLTTFFTITLAFFFNYIRTLSHRIFYLPAMRGAFGELEAVVIMPQSTFNFMITALLTFAEIKSQGHTEFPFQTHPQAVMASINSLLVYGLASAVEYFINSATRLGPISVYAIIARLEPRCYFITNVTSSEAQGSENLESATIITT